MTVQSICSTLLLITLISISTLSRAQYTVDIQDNESWWPAQSQDALELPLLEGYRFDPKDVDHGSMQSYLVSDQGRYIWCKEPFAYQVSGQRILITSDHEILDGSGGKTLQEALDYVRKLQSPKEQSKVLTIDKDLLRLPRYDLNRIMAGQINQTAILGFAHQLLKDKYPAGILIIDDGWQQANGDWQWDLNKYPDAKKMINILHEQGFRVMVTVNPFVSPDRECYHRLAQYEESFVKDDQFPEEPKIIKWKGGYSALLDMGNSHNRLELSDQLDRLQASSGVDGFVFEGVQVGQIADGLIDSGVSPCQLIQAYMSIAKKYGMSIILGGCNQALSSALSIVSIEDLNWMSYKRSIKRLAHQAIQGSLFSGLSVPGLYTADSIPSELLIRIAQLQAVLPATEIPYIDLDVLSDSHKNAYLKTFEIKKDLQNTLEKLIGKAVMDGIPTVQPMHLYTARSGSDMVDDQIMVGDKLLIAPIMEADLRSRTVYLPDGIWLSQSGRGYQGPMELKVTAAIDEIPYFTKAIVKPKG